MNCVMLSGVISDYGVKLSYTELSKPQLSFSLTVSAPGRDGAVHRTFVQILVVGAQAEPLAETLEPGDYCLIEGKLAWKSGKSKDAGKLVIACYGVEVLTRATVAPAIASSN